jgi:hypothetical protein
MAYLGLSPSNPSPCRMGLRAILIRPFPSKRRGALALALAPNIRHSQCQGQARTGSPTTWQGLSQGPRGDRGCSWACAKAKGTREGTDPLETSEACGSLPWGRGSLKQQHQGLQDREQGIDRWPTADWDNRISQSWNPIGSLALVPARVKKIVIQGIK